MYGRHWRFSGQLVLAWWYRDCLLNILMFIFITICIMRCFFQLHAVCSSVGKLSLVLRHSDSQIPPNSGGIVCWIAELRRNFAIFLFIFFSFTLYLAHSRVGRGTLVLGHSVLHFPPISGDIACWVAELNAALSPRHQSEKIKI